MKISIKTQDIELNYEDEYSKIEAFTVQNINDLIEKIHQKKHKCEYCNNQSGLVIENKIKEPTIFGVPNGNTSINTSTPFFRNPPDINLNNK